MILEKKAEMIIKKLKCNWENKDVTTHFLKLNFCFTISDVINHNHLRY